MPPNFERKMENIVSNNERYTLEWIWKNNGNGGHIINMERANGEFIFIDAQVGKIMAVSEFISAYGKNLKPSTLECLRVDDKFINYKYADELMKGVGK